MVDHPFGPPVPSVALSPNSLVFVVAQLRFPPVVSINEDGFVGPFQELIRSEYPNLEKAVEAQITLSPDGVHRTEGGVLWKFSTSDSSWHVALTSSFVAVSTSAYSNRNEFLTRLDCVLAAQRGSAFVTSTDSKVKILIDSQSSFVPRSSACR